VNDKEHPEEQGQSIVIVAMAMIVLMIFVIITVDLAYAYVHRRGDQNAADAAALAGARELANQLNYFGHLDSADACYWPNCSSDLDVKTAMNDFAERNAIEDTGGASADAINTNVEGYYLAADGTRLSNQIQIGNYEFIPSQARGVEAIVHSTAPSFFGGFLGLSGLPIQAEAAVAFQGGACFGECIAPIATLTMAFESGLCYNIWDGPRQTSEGITVTGDICSNDPDVVCTKDNQCAFGPCDGNTCKDNPDIECSVNADCDGVCGGSHVSMSGLGWLNWALQGNSCQTVGEPDDCSSECTVYNLKPGTCLSGWIEAGRDWVAGGAGVKNDVCTRKLLDCYAGIESSITGCPEVVCTEDILGQPITVIIYDVVEGTGCNSGQQENKMKYHVVGFAKFQILGYELSQGSGSAAGLNPDDCVDWGGSGNRITGEFIDWADGTGGECDPIGNIIGASMIK
jgi:hypothetical protein